MKPLFVRRAIAGLAFAAAAFTLAPAAAAYSGLYVFGDSLSDSGNNALLFGIDAGQVITGNTYIPSLPYASGVYSNGPVWTASFAAGLGLSAAPSLAGGGNYAYGGARTRTGPSGVPSLRTQVSSFLGAAGGTIDPDSLYVVEGGGNNARDTLDAIAGGAPLIGTLLTGAVQYAVDVKVMVNRLQAAGAQHIVVWNTPNLAFAPAVIAAGSDAVALAGVVAGTMNNALSRVLAGEPGVTLFDTTSLFESVVADPAGYGLSNVADACGAIAGCDPSTYLFWDGIHPTSGGHAIIAEAMLLAVVPEPGSVGLFGAGSVVVVLLAWRRRRRLQPA